MSWDPPEEQDFEFVILQVIAFYESAINNVVNELTRINMNRPLTASEQRAVLNRVDKILDSVDRYAREWVNKNIEDAYQKGQAYALASLGKYTTVADALDHLQSNRVHREFIKLFEQDAFNDLLQATANTRKQVKRVVREVVAEQMRSRIQKGQNVRPMIRDIAQVLRERLGEAGQFAIRDKANRVWRIPDYVDVVVRTKLLQAHMEGIRNEALSQGVLYGVVSSHGAKDSCRFHEGRIVKLVASAPGPYPTVDDLRASNQIFHCRCKHLIIPIRDSSLLPASIQQKAERQARIGDAAMATGKRNPSDQELGIIS